MVRGAFWTKTGFVTKDFEEAIIWISVLTERKIIFGMTARHYNENETWYMFATNANRFVAEELIEKEDFHDEFPIPEGGIFG